MKLKGIHAMNVTQIAEALLQLEINDLQEKYHLDAPDFIYSLQAARLEYLHPQKQENALPYRNPIDTLEQTLRSLIRNVQTFMSLLTEEAKQKIEKQFTLTSH